MNPTSPARSITSTTFDSTSSDYYKKLNKAGYISDAQLAAAESGNKGAIAEANNDVFQWEMFQSIRQLTTQQSDAIDPYSLASQRKRDEKLEAHYKTEGYEFVKIKSANHNCLIAVMLQHLTGDYTSAHEKKAQYYRDKLNVQLKKNPIPDQKILDNDLLVADHLDWLLPQMAKDPELKFKNPTVEIWVAADEGRCVSFPIGSGKDKFIIFSRADHFEAVIKSEATTGTASATHASPTVTKPTASATTTAATTTAASTAKAPVATRPTTTATPATTTAATTTATTATTTTAATTTVPMPSVPDTKATTTQNTGTATSSAKNSALNASDAGTISEEDPFIFTSAEENIFDEELCPINSAKPDVFASDTNKSE